jgi:hypothetical protein
MASLKKWYRLWLVVGCVGAIASGCTRTSFQLRPQPTLKNADITLQSTPANQPGTFSLSGTATLPDDTELHVIAVRRLHLQQAPLNAVEPQPTYSILTYETATVEDKRWQTTLSLWQVAPTGEYKETWQLQAPQLQLKVDPEDEVFFLVTLTPLHRLSEIEQELAATNQRLGRQLIRTTSEGDRYLQTGQVLSVALPTGQTAPMGIRPEDINGGWGNRFLDLPDLPNERRLELPEQRQTDAPAMPEEFLY